MPIPLKMSRLSSTATSQSTWIRRRGIGLYRTCQKCTCPNRL